MRRALAVVVSGGCLFALTATGIAAANIVQNGSLENLKGKFTNTRCNYMAVRARSRAIDGWRVPAATTGELAWGKRTCDGYSAAKGAFFLDLTGFGADSTNGAIRQTLRTRPGKHYRFSIDVCSCNDGSLGVKVGTNTLSLSAGKPFVVGSTSWTRMTARFTGPQDRTPVLKIKNVTPGAQIVVIDGVAIEGQHAAAGAAATSPGQTPPWQLIPRSALEVTDGTITSAGPKALLETADPGMRASVLDGGRHARDARLWFRYLGESTTTEPLGSGLIRRQIGLKLRAPDPCNLLYVMWHAYPDDAIQVQVKRNPGQTTSAECGNRGYTTITTIPLGQGDATSDHSAHLLQAETRRSPNGALVLTLHADGELLPKLRISAPLTAGLRGPIGVRSDNGHYLFRISGRR